MIQFRCDTTPDEFARGLIVRYMFTLGCDSGSRDARLLAFGGVSSMYGARMGVQPETYADMAMWLVDNAEKVNEFREDINDRLFDEDGDPIFELGKFPELEQVTGVESGAFYEVLISRMLHELGISLVD